MRKDVDADVKKVKADGEIEQVELCYDIYEKNLVSYFFLSGRGGGGWFVN